MPPFLTTLHARQQPPADRERLTGRHGLAVDSDQGAEALPTGRVEVLQVRSQKRPCDHCKRTGPLRPPTRPCPLLPRLLQAQAGLVRVVCDVESIDRMHANARGLALPAAPAGAASHPFLTLALPCRCACSYPLLTVVGVAASTVVYCSYRALAHNPDVQ